MSEKEEKKCTICGKPSPVTICEKCQATVQAEAVGEKKKSEKGVDVGGEVIADRAAHHKN
ncbi:MAG: hypothetical protein GTO02_19225 [Candidatus Dadabacteria bacterium]|nr:hypothetical protein [Candidatus Dadabacteria bacterium]NIQ16441.1 hypothetical protein [Candidatus Dadabacteria bacterium]